MSKLKHASLVNVYYIPGTSSVKQGFKGGSRPSGYCKGDNGSFRTFTSADYVFTFEMDKSGKQISFDLYEDIKEIIYYNHGLKRLTEKVRDKIEHQLSEKGAMIDYKSHQIELPEFDL